MRNFDAFALGPDANSSGRRNFRRGARSVVLSGLLCVAQQEAATMNISDDPGGRSGVFPRADLLPPEPAQVDAPPQRRPAPADTDILTGEAPVAAEGEDRARDEAEAGPDADAP